MKPAVRQVDIVISRSPAETAAVARRIAATLPHGAIVALNGDLGAGKTVFARGLCEGLGCTADVVSPTFTLVHEYPSPEGLVVHADFYRLGSKADVEALGLDELFAGARCAIVEWAERYPELLPPDALVVSVRAISESEREIVLS